ncbi:hypothetical protein Daura_43495 [Dactylosporangium aurantiacum]|uniref:Uncharacterized protein n=1 Tax=Dactylosporangium aurantiacum TaxID=35754 RepID=A0A9Q9MBV9_9ACTN|nr:DUF6248 family natural product biosynthesis protein [Dactylosporangium aurantiacum]MDG6102353.1 DUF6248 family natural product biosynthesis protein [Dactylosporangium aurantiacum]UWZ53348.1 hypothetical protein Daura_43495 [Dactylosporangium aurantiacum]
MTGREPVAAGETVYLTPKTRGAARECWSQPRAVVLAVADPFVTVRLVTGRTASRPRAVIPSTPAVMDPAAGVWIREHVLNRKHHRASRVLDETCPCQWGPCGHCLAGRHDRCAHRQPGWNPVSSETYVVNRLGYVLAEVWRATGPACAWHCPCPAPDCAVVVPDGPVITTHAANVVRTLPTPAARRRRPAAPPAGAEHEALTLW